MTLKSLERIVWFLPGARVKEDFEISEISVETTNMQEKFVVNFEINKELLKINKVDKSLSGIDPSLLREAREDIADALMKTFATLTGE